MRVFLKGAKLCVYCSGVKSGEIHLAIWQNLVSIKISPLPENGWKAKALSIFSHFL